MTEHKTALPSEWIEARRALLAKEKELTRLHDDLARQRRELPWEKVQKQYTFDSPHGRVTLADLFGGHSQLMVYHFMFGPDWNEGCPSCSYVTDHIDAALPHLRARDVSLMLVSRAPIGKISAFKKRMGWRTPWVSSFGSDFNFDFHVSFEDRHRDTEGRVDYNYKLQKFPSTEAPGANFFYNEPGSAEIFHTYSCYGRGLDALLGTYTMLDMAPKGRDEENLNFAMEWVRYHDRYEGGGFADADKPYWPKVAATSSPAGATGSACGCGAKS